MTSVTAAALTSAGFAVDKTPFFDTFKVDVSSKGWQLIKRWQNNSSPLRIL
jgi:hypothetical protein